MLKSIGTTRSEYTVKHGNKESTDYIVPDLIDFFGKGWKGSKRRLTKEIFIVVKSIVLCKTGFLLVIFW